jgi:hypothetical protein
MYPEVHLLDYVEILFLFLDGLPYCFTQKGTLFYIFTNSTEDLFPIE